MLAWSGSQYPLETTTQTINLNHKMDFTRIVLAGAGIMLLLAIPPMWPYAYYESLRIVVSVAAVMGAYRAHKLDLEQWKWIMVVIAVLFNPIIPVHLSKEMWVVPDLLAAVFMFIAAAVLIVPKSKHE